MPLVILMSVTSIHALDRLYTVGPVEVNSIHPIKDGLILVSLNGNSTCTYLQSWAIKDMKSSMAVLLNAKTTGSKVRIMARKNENGGGSPYSTVWKWGETSDLTETMLPFSKDMWCHEAFSVMMD